MSVFPFFIELAGKRGLIVGGGEVALRKCKKLLPYGPRLRVIAPRVHPELASMEGVVCLRRPFCMEDLEGEWTFVIAATERAEENRRIARACQERGILVNVVDGPEESGFLFPALIQRGKLSVGISTSGASPTAAKYWKRQWEEQLPAHTEELLADLERLRREAKEDIPDAKARAAFLRKAAEDALGAPEEPTGGVALVGAGCGPADLITLRGLRLLRRCDAVVYDALIDRALLEEAPEYALRYGVGKRGGQASPSQAEITDLLITLARQGKQVVRLKGGDPYLFGRGGEEALALQAAGIPFQVVPGVSSAMGIPAEAGIPVTHRGASRSVHIVTARTADGSLDHLAGLSGLDGTLVILMGAERLLDVTETLIAGGMSPETPAALLSGGCAPRRLALRGSLATLPELAKAQGAEAPAVIVVGKTAAMDLNGDA